MNFKCTFSIFNTPVEIQMQSTFHVILNLSLTWSLRSFINLSWRIIGNARGTNLRKLKSLTCVIKNPSSELICRSARGWPRLSAVHTLSPTVACPSVFTVCLVLRSDLYWEDPGIPGGMLLVRSYRGRTLSLGVVSVRPGAVESFLGVVDLERRPVAGADPIGGNVLQGDPMYSSDVFSGGPSNIARNCFLGSGGRVSFTWGS